MRELGILGDLVEAGAGVAQFRKGLQSRLGELRPTLGKLVHPLTGNSVESCHRLQIHSRFASKRPRSLRAIARGRGRSRDIGFIARACEVTKVHPRSGDERAPLEGTLDGSP